jgi:hypothetical protein
VIKGNITRKQPSSNKSRSARLRYCSIFERKPVAGSCGAGRLGEGELIGEAQRAVLTELMEAA